MARIFQLILLSLVVGVPSYFCQWVKQTVNTTASFRGLSVVNDKVIWASGTGGTVVRTIDGGKKWDVIQVPDAAKLDFRDIEAFDASTAYILSIGNGESSRIYKTTDGGNTWVEQFRNKNEKAFFDAIACWDRENCVAMSDPVDDKYVLIGTRDGITWRQIDTDKMPSAKPGEAAFAASGTCLIAQGRHRLLLVSGGSDARVFRSEDKGTTWFVAETPMAKGTSGSGIFSIVMFNGKKGIIVGGNYEKPNERDSNLAHTYDGGRTWLAGSGLGGYRSGVTYADGQTVIAVGSTGSDISRDGGKTWQNIDELSYNAVQAKGSGSIWAVGEKGMVARMK
ncbi:MAG: hypothetical protein K1X36_00110 [Pyrinomonadaceae bacterium]|nr:hypothetical protein [Pyrinomonadaceae bacterium]